MGLKIADLLPDPVEVKVGKGSMQVRGLGTQAMATLLATYKDHLLVLFGKMDIVSILLLCPDIVVDVVAAASDEPIDDPQAIKKIPVQQQADLIAAIYRETVPDPKKFEELLDLLAVKVRQLRKSVEAPQTPDAPTNKSATPSSPSSDKPLPLESASQT